MRGTIKEEIFTSKNSTGRENFYTAIISELNNTTNLSKIATKFKLSKQNLNYHLRQMKNCGLVVKKSKGWWEAVKSSKNSTKYGGNFPKDYIRGHAYIWEVELPKNNTEFNIKWERRVEILQKNNINFTLVGALKDVPRIKVLGRKVWLCKDHLRIFEKKNSSFYAENALESKKMATNTFLEILGAIENKLGITINPINWESKKEHYALIKNDLAVEHNKKGEVLRVKYNNEEWLLVDDSLGEGGELETVGKSSFSDNMKLQKWWNENKETNFEVTPKFILNSFDSLIKDRAYWAENQRTHVAAIQTLATQVENMSKEISRLNEIISSLKSENKNL